MGAGVVSAEEQFAAVGEDGAHLGGGATPVAPVDDTQSGSGGKRGGDLGGGHVFDSDPLGRTCPEDRCPDNPRYPWRTVSPDPVGLAQGGISRVGSRVGVSRVRAHIGGEADHRLVDAPQQPGDRIAAAGRIGFGGVSTRTTSVCTLNWPLSP